MVNSKDKWEKLLTPVRVIRDPVHGDIWITELESKIIDSELFQRLRYIKQLGTSYLVYPSAQHTRFEHCIGTLFVAQRIINAIQRNYANMETVLGPFSETLRKENLQLFNLDSYDIVLTRVVALLHDAAHIPYGHTLEKEGNLFRSQWADEWRTTYIFEKCGLRQKIVSYLKEFVGEQKANGFVEELISVLRVLEGVDPESRKPIVGESPEDEAIRKLQRPYVGDIVGNTICADLIDYVLRDSYFTGLKLSSETRIIEDFAIVGKEKGHARLTLLLIEGGRLKEETLSGAIQFLRERYHLAERVYYHRVKSAASVMIIGAVYAYLKALNKSLKDEDFMEQLMQMGDETLIYKLAEDVKRIHLNSEDQERAQRMVQKLLKNFKCRFLYKPVYVVLPRRCEKDKVKLDELIERYAKPEERYRFERYLEDLLELEPGSILMYITKRDLGKAANVRCLWIDGKVKTLKEIGFEKDLIKQELEVLENKYFELWKIYVLTDRETKEKCGRRVANFCTETLFKMNDIEDKELTEEVPPEGELFLDLHTNVALTPVQRQLFLEKIKVLKTANPQFSELGVPKEVLEKEFLEVTKAFSQNQADRTIHESDKKRA